MIFQSCCPGSGSPGPPALPSSCPRLLSSHLTFSPSCVRVRASGLSLSPGVWLCPRPKCLALSPGKGQTFLPGPTWCHVPLTCQPAPSLSQSPTALPLTSRPSTFIEHLLCSVNCSRDPSSARDRTSAVRTDIDSKQIDKKIGGGLWGRGQWQVLRRKLTQQQPEEGGQERCVRKRRWGEGASCEVLVGELPGRGPWGQGSCSGGREGGEG